MNREDKIPGSVRSIHGYILTYSIPTKEDPLITRGSQQREPPFLRPWYPTAGQHQRTKGGSESFRNDLNSEFHSAHPHFEVDLFWMFSKNKKMKHEREHNVRKLDKPSLPTRGDAQKSDKTQAARHYKNARHMV